MRERIRIGRQAPDIYLWPWCRLLLFRPQVRESQKKRRKKKEAASADPWDELEDMSRMTQTRRDDHEDKGSDHRMPPEFKPPQGPHLHRAGVIVGCRLLVIAISIGIGMKDAQEKALAQMGICPLCVPPGGANPQS